MAAWHARRLGGLWLAAILKHHVRTHLGLGEVGKAGQQMRQRAILHVARPNLEERRVLEHDGHVRAPRAFDHGRQAKPADDVATSIGLP